jgi:hypothetical protein
MFWVFKLSFVVDILAFFDLATFWAILEEIWQFFFLIIWSLCLNNSLPFSLFPCISSGSFSQTLDIKKMKQVFCHCATTLSQDSS